MSEYQYYYNYDTKTGEVREEGDEGYYEYEYYQHELNRKTPLIIWTKNASLLKKLRGENKNVMGMYDVLPTIGNMMGFENKYALGHDIYDIGENNVVIFPNGNFVTNKVYYNNSTSMPYIMEKGTILEENYTENLAEYTDKLLELSDNMVVHDLIVKEGDKIPLVSKEEENEKK